VRDRRRIPDHDGHGPKLGSLVLPVAVLLVAVALLSGLVFGGVMQGRQPRSGPAGATTTEATVLIKPRLRRDRGA
jgi:hypothetical protein